MTSEPNTLTRLFKLAAGAACLVPLAFAAYATAAFFALRWAESRIVVALPALDFLDGHLLRVAVDLLALGMVLLLRAILWPLPALPGRSRSLWPRWTRAGLVYIWVIFPILANITQYFLERPDPSRIFGPAGARANLCVNPDGWIDIESLDTVRSPETGVTCSAATPELAAKFLAQHQAAMAQEAQKAAANQPPANSSAETTGAKSGAGVHAPTDGPSTPTETKPPAPDAGKKTSILSRLAALFHRVVQVSDQSSSESTAEETATKPEADSPASLGTPSSHPTFAENRARFTSRLPMQDADDGDADNDAGGNGKCTCACDGAVSDHVTTAAATPSTQTEATAPYTLSFSNRSGAWVKLSLLQDSGTHTYSIGPGDTHVESVNRSVSALAYTAETSSGAPIKWSSSVDFNQSIENYAVSLELPSNYSALYLKNVSGVPISGIEVNGTAYSLSLPSDARRYAMGAYGGPFPMRLGVRTPRGVFTYESLQVANVEGQHEVDLVIQHLY